MTTTYLIENTTSGVLLGAYSGVSKLHAYCSMLDDAGDTYHRTLTEVPSGIHVYDPATLDRELTNDERAALELVA